MLEFKWKIDSLKCHAHFQAQGTQVHRISLYSLKYEFQEFNDYF